MSDYSQPLFFEQFTETERKAYVVSAAGGCYEDAYEHPLMVFLDKRKALEAAKKYIDEGHEDMCGMSDDATETAYVYEVEFYG